MTRTRVFLLLAVTGAVAGGCDLGDSDKAGGEQAPKPVVLTLANHDSSLDLDEFVREVERRSGGSVRIELENDWRRDQVDYEPRTIQDVRQGKADMGKVSTRAFDTVGLRTFQPLVAPFAVNSYALERGVLRSAVAERMLRSVQRLDVVGIALLPGEMRRPIGISRRLVSAADYRGATIATRLSRLGLRTFRELGANGEASLPGDDVSDFDGAEAGVDGLIPERDDLEWTWAVNVSLWPRVLAIVMNRNAYRDLSAKQRQALHAAGRTVMDPALQRIRSREREALGILCRRGDARLASAAQLRGLQAATSAITRELEASPATRVASREIAALRAEVEPEPSLRCGPRTSKPAAGERTPIDGLWRMSSTKSEYARIAPPADVVPENWGKFTMAMLAGRFAATTENGEACLWVYGGYEVKANVLEWTVEDGGGISVTEEDFFNYAGEFFSWRWSRYRDRLTLGRVQGAVSPEPFRVNPWRLLEATPSVGDLSRRCLPPRDALQP